MFTTFNSFNYNGTSSLDYGLTIYEKTVYSAPERDVSLVDIPGRCGNLILDNKRYKNIDIQYKCNIVPSLKYEDLAQRTRKIKAWLMPDCGYFKLLDTYNKGYYRLACYNSALEIEEIIKQFGRVPIQFNCKPFMYSFVGQQVIVIAAPTTIYNPEAWPSQPKIKIVGNGDVTLQINGVDYKFTKIDGYIEIDTDMMMAYKDNALQNDKILFSSFPALAPGKNEIAWDGNVTQINIVPRWCCL